MSFISFLPRIVRGAWPRRAGAALAGLLAAVAGHAAPAAAVSAAATEPTVRGFIVRLRDAPAHAAPNVSVANASAAGQRRGALAASAARWRAVLDGTGLGHAAALHLQPVGRDAWRVVFTGATSHAQVAHWTAALAQRPEVDWVVPNERETAQQAAPVVPDDPSYGAAGQWWLLPPGGSDANVLTDRRRGLAGFQAAWSRTTGSAVTVVAVLDSGIVAHPDLDASRLLPGYDMVSDWDAATGRGYANDGHGRDADPTDPGDWVDTTDQATDPGRYASCPLQPSDWHGTAVAGFLAAATNNHLGLAATTWAGQVLPVRVAGKCGAEVADIVDGLRWAAGLAVCRVAAGDADPAGGCADWAPRNPHPARVVNISFGGSAACNAAYQDAIDEVRALGVVVVAAAGNGHGAPTRPASCNGVVGVAALNRDGFKAAYSNFGPSLAIATTGGDDTEGLWGPLLTDGGLLGLGNDGTTVATTSSYVHHYGTSFAAPIVSGAIALMLAADPALGVDDIVAGLRASARPHVASPWLPVCSAAAPGRCACTTATCGAGILDADQAVAWAQARAQGVAYVAPTWPAVQIANEDVRQAVALGADLPGTEAPAQNGGGATTTTPTSPAAPEKSGGGATAPVELLLLAAGGLLLRARTPRRGRRRGG